jgi:hypothetical protein
VIPILSLARRLICRRSLSLFLFPAASGGASRETLTMNIIAKIAAGAVTLWRDIESAIEADAAKVRAALPASSLPNFDAAVASLKQGASDALGAADGSLAAAAPDLTKGIDALVDSALATLTNGLATPLVPIVNLGLDQLESLTVNAVRARILKAKADMAAGAAGQAAPPAAA